MNKSLTLNMEEINKLKTNINKSKEDIYTLLKEINSSYSELGTNVTGASIKTLIDSIELNIATIINSMSDPFDELIDYLDNQAANSTNEYQNALSTLTEAFAFIETNL